MAKSPVPKDKRTVLITGASAGIGAAIAREFAQRDWNLALTARREPEMVALARELEQAHGVAVGVYPFDLASPSTPRLLVEAVQRDGHRIDGLVNNAGYGAGGRFDEGSWSDHAAFLQVLLHAPVELAHLVLGPMRAQRFGRIINVASIAGFLPGLDENNMYNATKSFLVKFSESLHTEMSPYGVHVCALCPGFTRTEFHDAPEYDELRTQVPDWAWQDATTVARMAVEAAEKNQAICIPGALNKSIAGLSKALPHRLTRTILNR